MNENVAEQKVRISTEIEILRQMTNKLVTEGSINGPEILAISKEIDELVIKYMKLEDASSFIRLSENNDDVGQGK